MKIEITDNRNIGLKGSVKFVSEIKEDPDDIQFVSENPFAGKTKGELYSSLHKKLNVAGSISGSVTPNRSEKNRLREESSSQNDDLDTLKAIKQETAKSYNDFQPDLIPISSDYDVHKIVNIPNPVKEAKSKVKPEPPSPKKLTSANSNGTQNSLVNSVGMTSTAQASPIGSKRPRLTTSVTRSSQDDENNGIKDSSSKNIFQLIAMNNQSRLSSTSEIQTSSPTPCDTQPSGSPKTENKKRKADQAFSNNSGRNPFAKRDSASSDLMTFETSAMEDIQSQSVHLANVSPALASKDLNRKQKRNLRASAPEFLSASSSSLVHENIAEISSLSTPDNLSSEAGLTQKQKKKMKAALRKQRKLTAITSCQMKSDAKSDTPVPSRKQMKTRRKLHRYLNIPYIPPKSAASTDRMVDQQEPTNLQRDTNQEGTNEDTSWVEMSESLEQNISPLNKQRGRKMRQKNKTISNSLDIGFKKAAETSNLDKSWNKRTLKSRRGELIQLQQSRLSELYGLTLYVKHPKSPGIVQRIKKACTGLCKAPHNGNQVDLIFTDTTSKSQSQQSLIDQFGETIKISQPVVENTEPSSLDYRCLRVLMASQSGISDVAALFPDSTAIAVSSSGFYLEAIVRFRKVEKSLYYFYNAEKLFKDGKVLILLKRKNEKNKHAI